MLCYCIIVLQIYKLTLYIQSLIQINFVFKDNLTNLICIMVEEKLDRLKKAISYLVSIGAISFQAPQKDIASKIGGNHTNISSALKGNKKYLTDNLLLRINNAFNNIFNESWLLTGEGDMLKKEANNDINITGSYGVSVGDNNRSTYSNIGNSYNFALPEKGHVKIIRPDGTVSAESYNSDIENRLAELEALREKIVVLDKLVKSQEEQIELYKMKIDMLEHRQ